MILGALLMVRGSRFKEAEVPLNLQPRTLNNLHFAKRNKGQSLLEYAVLVAVVTSALALIASYIRQAVDANTKMIEDELSGKMVEKTF